MAKYRSLARLVSNHSLYSAGGKFKYRILRNFREFFTFSVYKRAGPFRVLFSECSAVCRSRASNRTSQEIRRQRLAHARLQELKRATKILAGIQNIDCEPNAGQPHQSTPNNWHGRSGLPSKQPRSIIGVNPLRRSYVSILPISVMNRLQKVLLGRLNIVAQ